MILCLCIGINERVQNGYDNDENQMREQRREVTRLIIHDDYNVTTLPKYDFDIALLELAKPFELGPFVRTVCLPPTNGKFYKAFNSRIFSVLLLTNQPPLANLCRSSFCEPIDNIFTLSHSK